MKKVLIYGMCGMDNLGDDLMFHSVTKYLHSHNIIADFSSRTSWHQYFSNEENANCIRLLIYHLTLKIQAMMI